MGTCLRPSWTAMVWPTMSGMTVERRDHVLMTRLSRRRFSSSTLASRWSSTNGPFLSERPISVTSRSLGTATPCWSGGRKRPPEPPRGRCGDELRLHLLPPPALAAAPDDELVGGLAAAGAALRLAPGGAGVAAAGALALAAAERVVDRVHGDPAHRGALALPAQATGLAPVDQLLLGVA